VLVEDANAVQPVFTEKTAAFAHAKEVPLYLSRLFRAYGMLVRLEVIRERYSPHDDVSVWNTR